MLYGRQSYEEWYNNTGIQDDEGIPGDEDREVERDDGYYLLPCNMYPEDFAKWRLEQRIEKARKKARLRAEKAKKVA